MLSKDRQRAKEYREALLSFLLERDGLKCGICGEDLDDEIHIDHIVAVCDGGENLVSNLRATHPICNITRYSGPVLMDERHKRQRESIKRYRARKRGEDVPLRHKTRMPMSVHTGY